MANKEPLKNILLHAERIQEYFKLVKDFKTFENNNEKIEAIVFNYIQIGENANKLSSEFIENHPDLKIYKVIGLRNQMTHDYQGISIKIVYDITLKDLPILIQQIKKILKTKRG